MKPIFLFMTLIMAQLFLSCSSTNKSGQAGKNPASESDGTFPDLSNEDFNPPPPVPYLPHEDNFEKIHLKNGIENLLVNESLFRLDEDRLNKINESGKELGDPISQLISLCYQGKFEEAFRISDRIYRQYRGHPSYWNQLGTCYYFLGNSDKAILYYNKALDINKDYAPTLNNLGVLYVSSQKDQKALLAFKLAKEKGPFSLTPIFNMAYLYLKYGLVQNAHQLFKVLYRRDMQDPYVLIGLATSELLLGNLDSSIKIFSTLNSSHFNRPEVSINYSLALKLAKRDNEAKEILRSVKIEDKDPWKEYHTKVSRFIEDRL